MEKRLCSYKDLANSFTIREEEGANSTQYLACFLKEIRMAPSIQQRGHVLSEVITSSDSIDLV